MTTMTQEIEMISERIIENYYNLCELNRSLQNSRVHHLSVGRGMGHSTVCKRLSHKYNTVTIRPVDMYDSQFSFHKVRSFFRGVSSPYLILIDAQCQIIPEDIIEILLVHSQNCPIICYSEA